MARPPDVQTFQKWFSQTEKETLPLLTKDFANGRLKNTLVFKSYRKGAKLLKQNTKTDPLPKLKDIVKTDSIDCRTTPFDLETTLSTIERNDHIEGNVKLELMDIVECGNELHLKEILAEMLVGALEFKDLDNAIDYMLIGGDVDGLYFTVKCYDKPLTESAD